MAWPLTEYLTTGSYEGFDVIPELVKWCRENITPLHARFRFEHVDVANSFYHARGATRARQYHFPYEDTTFDFTFLTSVFTHMLMDDFRHYTGEIARTLKPGGAALMTFFLLNDESRRLKDTPESKLKFRHRRGRVMVEERHNPEAVVGYAEDTVRFILRTRGLEVQQILYGSWCGRERTVSFQDIVIARRTSTAAYPALAAEWMQSLRSRIKWWLYP
jgi:SAM-dependent methyltransferase